MPIGRSVQKGLRKSPGLMGPKLWIDPAWLPNVTRLNAAMFVRTAQQYLSAADNSQLDTLATTNKFTIEFWRNQLTNSTVTGVGHDRCYVAQMRLNAAGGWFLGTSGNINGGNSLRAIIGTNAGGTTFSQGVVNDSNGPGYSQGVVVYDGAGATDADKLKIYLDGVAQSVTFTGTIPATLQNPATPLTIGAWDIAGSGITYYNDCAINRVRIWKDAKTAGNVTTLYNSGAGLLHADLGALNDSNLVASYDLTEDGGTRVDSKSGNNLSENNGTIPAAKIVTRLVDRGPSAVVFTAPFDNCFHWESPTAMNSVGVLRNYGQHYLRSDSNPYDVSSGEILAVIRQVAWNSSESWYLGMSDKDSANEYFLAGFQHSGGTAKSRLRLRSGAGSLNGSVDSVKTDFAINTNYLMHYSGFGQFGADSFRFRWNGAVGAYTFTDAPAVHNKFADDIANKDTIMIGGFQNTTGIQDRSNMYIGEIVCLAPSVRMMGGERVGYYLANKFNMTLAG